MMIPMYKDNPKKKERKVITLHPELMFRNPPPLPSGVIVFLYYDIKDQFIERDRVDKLSEEEKAHVWWIPAINRKNAIRKLKKQFKNSKL